MIRKNKLVSGTLGEQFKMEMMISQITIEAPKISDEMPISLPVSILEVLNNKDKKGRMDRNMKLKKMVLHQHKLPG